MRSGGHPESAAPAVAEPTVGPSTPSGVSSANDRHGYSQPTRAQYDALLARAVGAEAERDALADKNRALAEKCRDLDMDAVVAQMDVPQQRAIWHDEIAAIVAERDAAQAKIAAVTELAEGWIASGVISVYDSAIELGQMVMDALAGLPADTTDPNR